MPNQVRGVMMTPMAIQLILELDTDADPISGWVTREDGTRDEFLGMLGLLSAIENVAHKSRLCGSCSGTNASEPGHDRKRSSVTVPPPRDKTKL